MTKFIYFKTLHIYKMDKLYASLDFDNPVMDVDLMIDEGRREDTWRREDQRPVLRIDIGGLYRRDERRQRGQRETEPSRVVIIDYDADDNSFDI